MLPRTMSGGGVRAIRAGRSDRLAFALALALAWPAAAKRPPTTPSLHSPWPAVRVRSETPEERLAKADGSSGG